MEKQTAVKLAEILNAAAVEYAKGGYIAFSSAVGKAFWLAFGEHEQSWLMQDVYIQLCGMDMTPR